MRNARGLLAALVIGIVLLGCSDPTAPRMPQPESDDEGDPPPSTALVVDAALFA